MEATEEVEGELSEEEEGRQCVCDIWCISLEYSCLDQYLIKLSKILSLCASMISAHTDIRVEKKLVLSGEGFNKSIDEEFRAESI